MIKATTFLVTAFVNIALGAAMFFMLLLSLNGFTGSQAEAGLILFIVWALLTALVAGILSFLSASYLINNKSYNRALAVFVAITIFVIVGAASDFVGFIAALFLTSAMR
jgi:archaellum component FlaG (FlaF/FlaG flagellin family)